MAGKGLNELELREEEAPALNYDDVPEFGGWAPPPQPGPYRFRTPADMSALYELYDGKENKQFVRVLFDKDAPLVIVKALDPKVVGTPFQTRISNEPRPRGKDKVEVSDADLLLKATGEKERPKGNKAFIDRMTTKANVEFGADISYNWNCSETRKMRVIETQADGSTKNIEDPEGRNGCGRKYYQESHTKKPEQQIKKLADGSYPYEIQCSCGNVVRAFANLENLRS